MLCGKVFIIRHSTAGRVFFSTSHAKMRAMKGAGDMTDLKEIGKFIAECRKEKGFTQKELGEKLNVTDRAVSKWETGD